VRFGHVNRLLAEFIFDAFHLHLVTLLFPTNVQSLSLTLLPSDIIFFLVEIFFFEALRQVIFVLSLGIRLLRLLRYLLRHLFNFFLRRHLISRGDRRGNFKLYHRPMCVVGLVSHLAYVQIGPAEVVLSQEALLLLLCYKFIQLGPEVADLMPRVLVSI
jgi:hypothetical protein